VFEKQLFFEQKHLFSLFTNNRTERETTEFCFIQALFIFFSDSAEKKQ
jgi:hypothetical protein